MTSNQKLKYSSNEQVAEKQSFKNSYESLLAILWLRAYHLIQCMSAVEKRPGGGGVLDISLGGEVRRGPSYPDPV